MEGIGRGCGSAGAGVGDPAADPELVVDSVLDAALGCAGDVTAAGEGELCVFEEEVVCPRPGSTMIPVASKAKHHFGPLIVFFSTLDQHFPAKQRRGPSLDGRLYALLFRNANGKYEFAGFKI